MKSGNRQSTWIFAAFGIVPVVWFALLTAPYLSGGLMEILTGLPEAMNHPFSIEICKDSVKTVLLFLLAYGLGIGIYPPGESTGGERNTVPLCGEIRRRSIGNTVRKISWRIN